MVYQEQVMQISAVIAGYSLGEADILRRAMGKKDAAAMAKQRVRFMAGAAGLKSPEGSRRQDLRPDGEVRGIRLQQVALRSLLAAGISHSVAEDALSSRVHGCVLTSETSKPENVVKYISECREMNIAVVPPDVQMSAANFTPAEGAIRFGLAAIKNVGHNAIESIIKARERLQAKGKPGFEIALAVL